MSLRNPIPLPVEVRVPAMLVPMDEYRRLKRIEKAAHAFDPGSWVPTAHLEGDELALRRALKPVKCRHNNQLSGRPDAAAQTN